MDYKLVTEGLIALGTLLAGIGAIYAAFAGVMTYRDSITASRAGNLIKTEEAFSRIMPTLMVIENGYRYKEKIVPLLAKIAERQRVDDDEFKLVHDLDNSIRFFYIFALQQQFDPKHSDLFNAYGYYWTIMTSPDCKELRDYIAKFYPTLRPHFKAEPSQDRSKSVGAGS